MTIVVAVMFIVVVASDSAGHRVGQNVGKGCRKVGKLVAGQLAIREGMWRDFLQVGNLLYYIRVRNDPQCFLIENVTLLLFYGYDPILFAESRQTHVKFGFPAVLG